MAALKDKERENALNEVRILASVNDPYIVGYKVNYWIVFTFRKHS